MIGLVWFKSLYFGENGSELCTDKEGRIVRE